MSRYHHGAQLQADGQSTLFRLWAPDASRVDLVHPTASPQGMAQTKEGWFELKTYCPAGSLYAYLIDGQLQVPDPASRRQQDSVHGFSVVCDPQSYQWKNNQWYGRPWEETVLYEIHAGACGGYKGVSQQLSDLAQLGITAIELMPVAAFSGTRNWGYDGVLPYAPATCYGSPDELKALIDQAHGLGLMVFMDVVYNHFGPDGNYLHCYASAFFRQDQPTPWGAAIDFSRQEVREFFIENALMWLQEYRCDGLRLDAVHAIPDLDFLTELATRLKQACPAPRKIHLVLENEHNKASLLGKDFTAQWNDDGHNILHALLTNETQGYYLDFSDDRTEKLAQLLREGFIFQGQLDRHQRARGEPSGHLAPTAFVLFLQNHDQVGNRAFGERLITLVKSAALRAATTLVLLSPMIPLLFMGEPWGSRKPFLFFTDYQGELAEAVRQGRRNEFSEFAEFSDPSIRAQIPDPNAKSTYQASFPDFPAMEGSDHRAWQALYRHLLHLRHKNLVPYLADAAVQTVEVLGDACVSACWQLGERRRLRIDINLGAKVIPAPPAAQSWLFYSNPRDLQSTDLPAFTTRVYLERERCHG